MLAKIGRGRLPRVERSRAIADTLALGALLVAATAALGALG